MNYRINKQLNNEVLLRNAVLRTAYLILEHFSFRLIQIPFIESELIFSYT
jgi:hypothetical protein